MKRFVKEYANYLLKELDTLDLMNPEVKQQEKAQIERVLNLYQRNFISVNEAMKKLSEI